MDSEPTLDPSLVTQALNFHGQQLQKIWESERGDSELAKLDQLDFAAFQARSKSFQDRGKRVFLHQFIAKEASSLFDSNLLAETPSSTTPLDTSIPEDHVYALMPPFETFLNIDKGARLRHFFQNLQTGDLIIGTVINRSTSGMMLKAFCAVSPTFRYVGDINVKAFVPISSVIPAVDKKNVSRSYLMNDLVCCEVLEVIPDTDKISCGMKGVTRGPDDPPPKPPLGLISSDDFPQIYKKTVDMKGESYEAVLEKSPGFNNPNCVAHLSEALGLSSMHCSNFLSLRGGFPAEEYADELRQTQASKWAFRSVAEGIEHFKAGRHSEAFQCLNKALSIDPRNVEGLVARGALYANSGTFKKAIEDFETSMKLNPNHANARKYMGETLVALGRSYEDENKMAEAQKAYEDCLAIIPFHEEAKSSLDFLKSKTNSSKPLIEPTELLLPGLSSKGGYEMKETLKQLLILTEKKEKKSKKKKKGKGKKKHRSSSSSSSSSESSTSCSSSESSSSSSESSDAEGGGGGHHKKKRRSRSSAKKQRSLSPLSKRMEKNQSSQFNHPYGWTGQPPAVPATSGPIPNVEQPVVPHLINQDLDYELKVRKFLEMTKEDSDYEEKVRNLLEETARYKRDRKMQELGSQEHEKSSKGRRKAKKESKKSKKESKRKRKEKEREERRKAKLAQRNSTSGDYLRDFDQNMDDKKFRDALRKELSQKPGEDKRRNKKDASPDNDYDKKHGTEKRILENIPDLEELESKLTAYYAKVEKDTGLTKRQDNGRPNNETFNQSRSISPEDTDRPKMKLNMNTSKDKSKKKETPRPSYKNDSKAYAFDESSDESAGSGNESMNKGKKLLSPEDKNISVRRAMALKEPLPLKHNAEPEPPGTEEVRPPIKNVVLDKFGSFRLVQEGETPGSLPMTVPLPPGQPSSGRQRPPEPRGRRPRSPPGRSRSRDSSGGEDRRDKKSPRKRSSRSRSRPRKYRSSTPGSRSSSSGSRRHNRRSRSMGSRSPGSRSEGSRSGGSRTRSRTRSRSRSLSRDRFRRINRRGGWRGRGYDRGTYYKPRFQPYGQRGGRGPRGSGDNFRRDDRRFDWRDGRGRGRPYRPRQRGNNRGRPFRGYRDYRDRRNVSRYSRSRSPDTRRHSRSYSPEENVRKHQDKDRVERYSERDGGRSEGEYEEERYVDRKEYDGKWADNGEHGGGAGVATSGGVASGDQEKNTEVNTSKGEN